MPEHVSRRAAIGMGAAAAALVATGRPAAAAPATTVAVGRAPVSGPGVPGGPLGVTGTAQASIRQAYDTQKARAGGVWHSHIAMVNAAGTLETVVADDADRVTHGYSVQKLAVAVAVMDKIDRGQLRLDQKLDLTADIILGGTGIYFLHTVWGDDITVANFLTAMLLVSDNTAVRMCGRVVPALEINEILASKGFTHTRVEPVANPNRFFLGVTTPRETHDLLWRLANKTIVTPRSADFLLGILRWINGYHDGVRRNMSSAERSRVATKYGADYDELGAARHEAGIMFDAAGAPTLTYAMFADSLGDLDNYGATHPAVQAHAVLGRTMFDAIATVTNRTAKARHTVDPFRPVSGG
ncbi:MULTISPECIES: serine hydrolase [unclassified Plantactinospora]|uniref:serine hydrolase n=1 Tax=unclassified Plantactinospora TaxID=2631981 RepID=UPI000D156EE4|nr:MULTISPECIES: serine hydrolase [unclassified Plantactinospora]AVT28247.1 serine hydrolase [Plantactinospora sp. BC1]AVT38519.1 serine hydrolase [Plantactinospora sp. BB1]